MILSDTLVSFEIFQLQYITIKRIFLINKLHVIKKGLHYSYHVQ